MPDSIQIESNAAEVMEKFHRFPAAVQTGILNGLKRSLIVLEGKVKTSAGVKFRRGSAGLAGRVTSYARKADLMGVEAAIGFRKTKGFPYELSQEFGAKAAPGKAMAIPISGEAKALSYSGQGPRAFPRKLHLVKTGRSVVLMESGLDAFRSGAGITAGGLHYVLVKSIPPRLNFRQTVLSNIPQLSEDIVNAERTAWRDLN